MTAPQGSLSPRHYGASPGSHAHPHSQALLGLDGVLELEVQGHGCVIAPGERHDFEARSGSRCLVLDTAQTGGAMLTNWTRQHLHEALSVAQLAQQVFLSPTRFAERCREETGLSAMQWLRSQRLTLAVHA